MNKMAGAGMWKSQVYGKLFELPTHLWISLREIHFPTFMLLFEDYLKSKVRYFLDTTRSKAPSGKRGKALEWKTNL